ncbi:YciI family protein [Arthrobacter castelli]|uniref:YciI family protein n=1 Tax=Arthrobacter castelli TaxID=271431 RepID=UPI0004082729|nr:YciI family protein [Arthrobacter castelli]
MGVFAVEYVYDAETAAARDEHRPAHRQWLQGHIDTGMALASGPYGDGAGALLVFKADSEAALLEELKQDPYNRAALVSGMRVKEWNPILGVLSDYAD